MAELKNKSALFEYFFDDKYEAGLVLTGTEVKSLREGKASFNDSYCIIHKEEIWLKSMHISEYKFGTSNNHEPTRDRKLLLRKREIKKITAKLKEKGYTLVPIKIFMSEKRLFKIVIGLGKGKKLHDKRQSIKDREMKREVRNFKI